MEQQITYNDITYCPNLPRTQQKKMYYVYVLKNVKTGKLYYGYSNNLKRRLAEHNKNGTWEVICPAPRNASPFRGGDGEVQ